MPRPYRPLHSTRSIALLINSTGPIFSLGEFFSLSLSLSLSLCERVVAARRCCRCCAPCLEASLAREYTRVAAASRAIFSFSFFSLSFFLLPSFFRFLSPRARARYTHVDNARLYTHFCGTEARENREYVRLGAALRMPRVRMGSKSAVRV